MHLFKVSIGVVQESHGREHNCIFGDWLREDPYCSVAYLRAWSFDTETPEKDMHFSCSHGGSGSAGGLLSMIL